MTRWYILKFLSGLTSDTFSNWHSVWHPLRRYMISIEFYWYLAFLYILFFEILSSVISSFVLTFWHWHLSGISSCLSRSQLAAPTARLRVVHEQLHETLKGVGIKLWSNRLRFTESDWNWVSIKIRVNGEQLLQWWRRHPIFLYYWFSIYLPQILRASGGYESVESRSLPWIPWTWHYIYI